MTPQTPQLPFRLLHISDLHFKEGGFPARIGSARGHRVESYGENEEKAFLRNLGSYLRDHPKDRWPKAVIVNGDLVDGKEKGQGKFEEATKFLKELAEVLGFEDDLKRIYVVPGNHDVALSLKPDAKPADRFSDYIKAVQPFTSPTLDDGPSPKIVNLNDKFGIDAELFLLVSPTFSGVSETVEHLLDRLIKPPEEAEQTEEVKKAIGEVKKVLERGEVKKALERGRWQFDLGSIAPKQCNKIREYKNNNEGNPIRIAVLHHHLVTQPGTTLQPYDAIINGGHLLDILIQARFDLVLTGHKHYRRLVRHSVDQKTELDIYSSPSLFKAHLLAPGGFTIINIWDAQAPHYASLEYFDMDCTPRESEVKLLREGRVSPKINEVCAGITTDDQKVVIPLLNSMKRALKWSKDHPAKGLVDVIWEEIEEDLKKLGTKEFVLRSPSFDEYWPTLIRDLVDEGRGDNIRGRPSFDNHWPALIRRVASKGDSVFGRRRMWRPISYLIRRVASNGHKSKLRLVSEDDLDFWLMSHRHNMSDAGKYEKPLKEFEGHKTRILVMDSSKLERDEDEAKKLAWVVRNMRNEGHYRVGIVRKEKVPSHEGFAIVNDSALITLEHIHDRRGGRYSRTLTVSFDEKALKRSKKSWRRLRSNLDWDSNESNLDIVNWVNNAYGHNLTQADLEGEWRLEMKPERWILE